MTTIHTLLIANRGEIASRIIRTCKKMGIKSVAVYSDADRNALFVSQADTAVYIGESAPAASYLDQDKIILAAQKTGANAIHPGYGFLSENVSFAKRCEQEGIIFVGPNCDAIAAMGSKSRAKELMQQHNVPTVPGYQGSDQSVETLSVAAIKIGFPVLLKATAGGGGKGMRIVHAESELIDAIHAAKRESLSAFGDDELIIEKYIASGRHIEFQIFGDKHGNALHLLERECTIQRRYQKVVEESPSPVMSEELRKRMGEASVNAAKALSYDNAGTVEFIYDDKSGEFYFLEVNTRLQVEHPVTEEVTGLDLVQMQIESAQGLPLQVAQDEIKGNGYAFELRLYAEDASNDFQPVTGKIERFELPQVDGLRVETAIQSGSEISVFYDPMIAKLIVWDATRQGAMRKMQYVLKNMVCLGMVTNQDFLLHLVQHPDVQVGKYNTHFIANHIRLEELSKPIAAVIELGAIAATLVDWNARNKARTLLRSLPSGWRNNFYDYQKESYSIGEESLELKYRYTAGSFVFKTADTEKEVAIECIEDSSLRMTVDGIQYHFSVMQVGNVFHVHNEITGTVTLIQQERFPTKVVEKVAGGYEAPMPSSIVKIMVSPGQEVKSGDSLLIISSMKMENTISAETDGVVDEVYATEGTNVEAGFLLLTLKTEEA
jgi:3-methylcrotonyl-CoA carboxylase alpha subunit